MNIKILVIDDDQIIRKAFTLALKESGYEVHTAESGEKGLDMESKTHYHLIFLDLNMPGLNGIETLKELRKKNKLVPVYIITSFHEEYIKELSKASMQGIDFDVLKKPIGKEEIVSITNAVINSTLSEF
ncbi:MAG: response regulator [Spirochaetales bacterium]|nr:response regulator [Spirochaetales bacterium]